MFTFALGLFAGHKFFSLYFQPLSAFRRGRKKEFGRKRPEGKTLITTTTCVRRAPGRVSTLSFLRSTVFIFSDRKCISRSWRKLMNYKPDNRIPSLFTDFDNIKDFPWPWKILVFPCRFPNRGNPGSWLVLACQIHWHLNKKCFFPQRLFIIQVQNQYWQLVICIQNLLSHGIHSF